MTTQQQTKFSPGDHDAVVSLIPWYVKGNLPADEMAAVKEHLDVCNSCRQELESCQALAGALPEPVETWKPSAAHFEGILADLDKLEAKQNLKKSANEALTSGIVERIRTLFAQTPRPVRWTLAAESLAFALLAAVMILPGHLKPGQEGAYETLSNGEPLTSSSGQLLRLVVADDMTTKELSQLLQKAKAQIRQGPSTVGAYTIEITSGDAAQAQATLRAHPKVRITLPVATNSPKP